VCWDVSKKETKTREIKSIVESLKKFNLKEGIIVTKDFEDKEQIEGKTILYVPLWKFLLS